MSEYDCSFVWCETPTNKPLQYYLPSKLISMHEYDISGHVHALPLKSNKLYALDYGLDAICSDETLPAMLPTQRSLLYEKKKF